MPDKRTAQSIPREAQPVPRDVPTIPQEVLSQCALFREMGDVDRQRVIELLEPREFPAGEAILQEGQAVQSLWIVVRGKCQVVKQMRGGVEQELAVLEPHSVFGEMSFFHPGPHSATIRALTDVELLRLDRGGYSALLECCHTAACKLAVNIVGVLSERLRRMDDWVCEHNARGKQKEEWDEFRAKLYSGWQF